MNEKPALKFAFVRPQQERLKKVNIHVQSCSFFQQVINSILQKVEFTCKMQKQNLFLKWYCYMSEASTQLQQERQPYDITNIFFLHPKQIWNTFLRVVLK